MELDIAMVIFTIIRLIAVSKEREGLLIHGALKL